MLKINKKDSFATLVENNNREVIADFLGRVSESDIKTSLMLDMINGDATPNAVIGEIKLDEIEPRNGEALLNLVSFPATPRGNAIMRQRKLKRLMS
jgi:hypothetical protein